MRIVHIITGLGDGGAEHTLYKICKYDNSNEHIVVSLNGLDKYGPLLEKLGIKVYCLNLTIISIYKFIFLIKLIRLSKPHIVQTWLVHADLLGGVAAKLCGVENIIWNIRYSNLEIGKAKFFTIIIINLLAKLSFLIPKFIVVVSKKAIKVYEKQGYDKKKFIFIPNGYDLAILKPNNFQKSDFRKKYSIKKEIPLIGNVARYDPKKGHLNLMHALSLLKLKNINFFCVFIGSNITKDNLELTSEIERLSLENHVKLLGQNNNIIEVMNGLDVYVHSSIYGEGFPNVVAESMACGTPCVVTDVGDASLIVGKTGWVIPPNNSKKLAYTIEKALNEIGKEEWNKRVNNTRLRVKTNFDISIMIKSYNTLWSSIHKKMT